MQKVSKKTLATIDKLVLEKYPNARKVDFDLISDREFDDFSPVAHYVICDIPGADELGFNDEYENDDTNYEVVALAFSIHNPTKRIFFWDMNNYGEPDCAYGESNGELMTDSIKPYLQFETAREHEVQ